MPTPRVKKPALSRETRQELVDAARAHDWDTLLDGISEHAFEGLLDTRAREDLLSYYAARTLKEHHQRWSERIGELLYALGFGEAPKTVEEALAEWTLDRSYEEQALVNARENLSRAASKNSSLKKSYAAELVGVGWRESYTSALAVIAWSDPAYFFDLLLNAPCKPGDTKARERRSTRIHELADQVGGLDELWALLDKPGRDEHGKAATIVQRLWGSYTALSSKTSTPDAVTLLLGLLSGERGRAWMTTQILARDGFHCARCGEEFDETNPPKLHRLTPRSKTADKPKDFELICERCAASPPPALAIPELSAATENAGDPGQAEPAFSGW